MLRESVIPTRAGPRPRPRRPRSGQPGKSGRGRRAAGQAARRCGPRRRRGFHRVTYCYEPALPPDPRITGQAGRAEQALRHMQSPGHVLGAAVHPESCGKVSAHPHLAAGDINREQNRRVRFDQCLQCGDGFPVNARGQYASFYRVITKKIIELSRDDSLESAPGCRRDRPGGRGPASGAGDQDRRIGLTGPGPARAPGEAQRGFPPPPPRARADARWPEGNVLSVDFLKSAAELAFRRPAACHYGHAPES